ncbi:MAG: hypothetical protein ACR652_24705 [Methylocystis sp.]|uniref:hypothetical protein n=1 Tax=Methylocystis sp. TaxID=1911079 RepID=UPI003DA4FF14
MPDRRVRDFQNGFAGGANPMAGSGIAPLDQYASVTNMRLIRNQELAKRPGLRSLGTTVANHVLYPWWGVTGVAAATPAILDLGSDSGSITPKGRTMGYGTPTRTPVLATTSTLTATTGTPDVSIYAASFRDGSSDCMYIGCRTYGMLKWNGTTITENVGTTLTAGMGQLWVYNQRLFGCKGGWRASAVSGERTPTLYWSGLNNGDSLNDVSAGGGSANIRAYGRQMNIAGGFALGGSNYILQEGAISVFRGTTFDDINITAGAVGVSPNIGLPFVWEVIDDTAYIVTSEGLYLLTEAGGVTPAGTPEYPDPLAQAMLEFSDLYSRTNNQVAPWFILDNARRREVWIVASFYQPVANTFTSKLFIYNTQLGRFTGTGQFGFHVEFATTVPLEFQPSVSDMLFVNGSNVYGTDFFFQAQNVFTDNGSNYESAVQFRRMYTVDDPASIKSWRQATVQMGSGAGITPLTAGAATGAVAKYVTNIGGTVTASASLVAQTAGLVQLSGQGPFVDLTVTDNGTISVGWSILRAEAEGYAYTRRNG